MNHNISIATDEKIIIYRYTNGRWDYYNHDTKRPETDMTLAQHGILKPTLT